jgi:galactokinase
VVLITNSNVHHELDGSEYPDRVRQCKEAVTIIKNTRPKVTALRDVSLMQLSAHQEAMDEVVYLRALHVIGENDRTLAAAQAINARNWDEVGRLMTESHLSLQKNYNVSCEELDILVNIAVPYRGVYGSRMTGGGFGGCTVTLVDRGAVSALMTHMDIEYYKATGKRCTFYVCEPESGAGALDLTHKPPPPSVPTPPSATATSATPVSFATSLPRKSEDRTSSEDSAESDSSWYFPVGFLVLGIGLAYLLRKRV